MKDLAKESFGYADSYLNTIEKAFNSRNRRFDNDLLYNMISICFERFMVSWLAYHDIIATSHLPLMLYRELNPFEPELNESIKKTAILIGSFEGICSIDDFGYRTPDNIQTSKMIEGLKEVRTALLNRFPEAVE